MFSKQNLKPKAAVGDEAHEDTHHIMSLRSYFAVFGALLVLTVATVGVSLLGLPHPWSIIVAMVVAIMKASLVAAFFMHLKFEEKFHTFIFISSLLFMGLFFVFTFSDLQTRGQLIEDQDTFVKQKYDEASKPAGETDAKPKAEEPKP